MTTKHCSKCATDKPAEEFKYKNRYWCRSCVSDYNRQYFLKKPEKFARNEKRIEREKKQYMLNKDKIAYTNARRAFKRKINTLLESRFIKTIRRRLKVPLKAKDIEDYLPNDLWMIDDVSYYNFDLRGFPLESQNTPRLTNYSRKILGMPRIRL
jgi:hypothetical protein